ncbi:MAG: hypothetical protein K6U80_16825 [Firmicutes bacterium]|nr:hypothetical protein [Bacillota bacterium]
MMTVRKEFRHTLIDWTFEEECIDELQYNLYVQEKIEQGINPQGRLYS